MAPYAAKTVGCTLPPACMRGTAGLGADLCYVGIRLVKSAYPSEEVRADQVSLDKEGNYQMASAWVHAGMSP